MLADGCLTGGDLLALPRIPRVFFANGCTAMQTGDLADQRRSDGSASTHDFAGGVLRAGCEGLGRYLARRHRAHLVDDGLAVVAGVRRDPEQRLGEHTAHDAVMTSDDREALWAWLQSLAGRDDLPAWKALLSLLDYRDPRRSRARWTPAQRARRRLSTRHHIIRARRDSTSSTAPVRASGMGQVGEGEPFTPPWAE